MMHHHGGLRCEQRRLYLGAEARLGLGVRRANVLAQDGEVRLVRGEGEHDQVGVEAVDGVLRVGAMSSK